MVLVKIEEGYVPQLISSRCAVPVGPKGEFVGDILGQLGVIQIAGDEGVLAKQGLLSHALLSNTSSHSGFPKKSDSVYYFIGKIDRLDDGLYMIADADRVVDLKIDFLKLLEKSPVERMVLANQIDPSIPR